MALVLARVGAESDWILLADIYRLVAETPSAEFEESLQDAAIKTKVLSRRDYLECMDGAENFKDMADIKALLAATDSDEKVIRAGLVDVRGMDIQGDDPELIPSLQASGLGFLVAAAVLRYQQIPQEQRPGFFTREAAAKRSNACKPLEAEK